MYVCVVDRQGKKLLHLNIQNNDFAFFLKKIAPWKHDLTVVCGFSLLPSTRLSPNGCLADS